MGLLYDSSKGTLRTGLIRSKRRLINTTTLSLQHLGDGKVGGKKERQDIPMYACTHALPAHVKSLGPKSLKATPPETAGAFPYSHCQEQASNQTTTTALVQRIDFIQSAFVETCTTRAWECAQRVVYPLCHFSMERSNERGGGAAGSKQARKADESNVENADGPRVKRQRVSRACDQCRLGMHV